MPKPNYTIIYKDEETKNVVLRITDTEQAGILLDVVLDEWVSEEELDAKLRQDVPQLGEADPVKKFLATAIVSSVDVEQL